MRKAVIKRGINMNVAEVAAYLPANYKVVSENQQVITIEGEDVAGWTLDAGQVYRCRHCPKDIMLRAGYWIDSDGIPYCKKRHRDTVTGQLEDPILHEPMPDIGSTP
jgi:hypothetical protein